jgi:hypothetical protein
MAKENQAVEATSGISTSIRVLIPLAVAGLAGAFWSWPAFVFLTFALLPSIVAAAVDHGPLRCATICVTSFNVAGIAPFVIRFWSVPDTYEVAVTLMTNVYVWLIIYSAAGLGWLLYKWFGFVSFQLHGMWRERRVAKLKARRTQIIEAAGLKLSNLKSGMSSSPNGASTAVQWKHDRIDAELTRLESSIAELDKQARWMGRWIAALFSIIAAWVWILLSVSRFG